MKIEVLFPEICNLYGDLFNVKYLKECLPDAEIIETSLADTPLFVTEKPDLIYMGTTTERGQILAIEALRPYKDRIKNCIEENVNFLITGNAMEIFFQEIIEGGEKVCDGLGIFDFTAKREARKRFNSLYLGDFIAEGEKEPIKIVGFKSLFGFAYGDNAECALFATERGDGLNPDCKGEGIKINHFFATHITGPLLVLNPTFTKWYMKHMLHVENAQLAFEEAALDAYQSRVAEFSDPGTGFYY